MKNTSRLFLTELFFAILFFTLSMLVCAGLFFKAHQFSQESHRQTQALYAAQTVAERFVAGEALPQLAAALSGQATAQQLVVGYDGDWQPCPPHEAAYLLEGTQSRSGSYAQLDVTVSTAAGEALYEGAAGAYLPQGGDRHVP